jgi:S-DNA-T family DNA segregation ATPase FtsK/SpoIIIE
MANKYELQAARIETVLGAHKVPARVWQAKVTPRFVRFDITTALGTRLTKVSNLAEELAFSLGVRTARVYREGGVLHVEVPRETPRAVDLAETCRNLPNVPAFCAVLGIDESGAPLLVRLDSPDVAHLLLAGTTGSGKTALLRTVLTSLAMHNHPGMLQLALIDPKGRGFGPLGALPHIWRNAGVVQEPGAAVDLLAALVAEMERRDRVNRSLPRIAIAIDELADLLQSGGKSVGESLQRLTQRGREAGLHVIAATQRPAAALVGGLVKANFPVRLVGSVVSAEDAKVASGVAGSNAERLLGRGDFLLIAKGQTIRFQAAFADSRELANLVAQVRAGGRRRRSWQGQAALTASSSLSGQTHSGQTLSGQGLLLPARSTTD